MAKAIFGPNIADARGKVGDVVYSRNRFGPYIRAWLGDFPTWTPTTAQTFWEDLHAAIMLRWQTALTDSQRQRWGELAHNAQRSKPVNGTHPLTPAQQFIRTNLFSKAYGGIYLDDAPSNQDVTQPLSLSTYSILTTPPDVDDFNRANAPNLGANWTCFAGSGFQIFSNSAAPNASASDTYAIWNHTAYGGDQFSEAVVAAGPSNTSKIGLLVRGTVASKNCYAANWNIGGGRLWRVINGVHTSLYLYSTAFNVNDVIRLTVVGSTLNLYKNGISVTGPIVDTIITTGQPGLSGNNDGTDTRLDNWTGGSYPTVPPLTITLDAPGSAGEQLVVRATPPLSAGILATDRWMKIIGHYAAPVTYPLNIYNEWKALYDGFTPPLGTLVTGKRVGVRAYLVRTANGAPSRELSANSITA